MKAWHRAGHGTRWLVAAALGLLGTLAWLLGPSLAQQTAPVSPPGFNAPGTSLPSSGEPPMADNLPTPAPAPAAPVVPAAPASPPAASPCPAPPAPTMPATTPQSPYYPMQGLAGLPPMVPAPGVWPPEPMDPPPPQVTLRVRVPARVAPGEKLTYRLLVENHSQARAHHVVVLDRLSKGATLVSATPEPAEKTPDLLWKLGTLEPAARKEITLVVKPAGKEEVENRAYVRCEHGQTVRTQVSRPGLRLRVSAPASAQLILPIDFKMEVINAGQVEARDVVLTSELPRDLAYLNSPDAVDKEKDGGNVITWKIGTLRPGQTWSRPLQVTSKQAGDYQVKSEVTAAGDLRETAHTAVKVGEGKLTLAVTGPATLRVDQPATYQLTVTNSGKVSSPGVEIVDRLFEGIAFRGASDGGQLGNNEIRWRLRALQPGESRTVSCTVQAQSEGLFANVVRAHDDMGLSALAHASTRFSWLTVAMLRRPDVVPVGQQTTLVFQVSNARRSAVTGATLSVSVPESLSVVPLSPQAGKVEGGRVTFEPVARLEPGETKAFSLQVRGVKAGKGMVRAELMTAEIRDCKVEHFARPLVCEETVQVIEGQDPARITFNR